MYVFQSPVFFGVITSSFVFTFNMFLVSFGLAQSQPTHGYFVFWAIMLVAGILAIIRPVIVGTVATTSFITTVFMIKSGLTSVTPSQFILMVPVFAGLMVPMAYQAVGYLPRQT